MYIYPVKYKTIVLIRVKWHFILFYFKRVAITNVDPTIVVNFVTVAIIVAIATE